MNSLRCASGDELCHHVRPKGAKNTKVVTWLTLSYEVRVLGLSSNSSYTIKTAVNRPQKPVSHKTCLERSFYLCYNHSMSLIIYTKTGCPWCIDALKFLKENNVQFEEREVRNNLEFMNELEQKSGQTKAPTIDLNGEILADTDVQAIGVFLKEKGIL